MSACGAIEKLGVAHDLSGFDCGRDELNRFLKRYALENQRANSAQTYVACQDGVVVGYYSLRARRWRLNRMLLTWPAEP